MPAAPSAAGISRCKNCDLVFTGLRTFDFDVNAAHVKAYHTLAREEYGREVRVWGLATIVQGETEKEARDFYNYYVHEKGDWDAADERRQHHGAPRSTSATIRRRRARRMAEMFVSGWGGFPLIGTKEQIVDGLAHDVADRGRRRAAVMAALRSRACANSAT